MKPYYDKIAGTWNDPDVAPNGSAARDCSDSAGSVGLEEGGYVWRLGMWWLIATVYPCAYIKTIEISTYRGCLRQLEPDEYSKYAPPTAQ